jgi:hypothetical protein
LLSFEAKETRKLNGEKREKHQETLKKGEDIVERYPH